MTREEFINMPINSLIYNDKDLAVTSSGFSNPTDVKNDQFVSVDEYFKKLGIAEEGYLPSIKVCDHDDWNFYSMYAPDKIQLKYLTGKVLSLENFVHTRLR